ncbi:MAG: substrate-binding domain-containing protein [Planctomycetales bacterium]
MKNRLRPVPALVALVLAAVAVAFLVRTPRPDALVVYCAHDAIFAEEILRRFERETGIPISVRFDTEATKSLGLVNLLLQERERPQCDLFWNNEPVGMEHLAQQGLLLPYQGTGYERIPQRYKDPEGRWVGFAARFRVYIAHRKRLPLDEPTIERLLTEEESLSRVAIAQPLYGTTLTHYSLLWHAWGGERLATWHDDLHRRGIREVAGNALTKNLVASGACDLGFTDTDDFFVARDAGSPVEMFPVRVAGETICIPNAVGILRGTTRLPAAQRLADYLLSQETELALARSASRQVPLGEVDAAELPEEVRPLVAWVAEGADLRSLASARGEVIRWLGSRD